MITDVDRWRFAEGTHDGLHHIFGAHLVDDGCDFAVWAPGARSVSVVGDVNDWSPDAAPMLPSNEGIWSAHIAAAQAGQRYKYRIVTASGDVLEKADPIAFAAEEAPATASRIWDLAYDWGDDAWMSTRGPRNAQDAPISTYEVHLGSWRYCPGGYRELAEQLADHLDRTGFTHVELMPVMEHPFYGSWGYQTTGYFAATSRYGSPQDLMYLIDLLHQRGYGVILDWVPSHFPTDAHGLAEFDGTHLYEHADPKLGFHPDWQSAIFNYDRHEVRSFLLSSARFWLEFFHVDGLRVDAVASMLYRDYSRNDGEWIPNEHGGNENLGAVSLLQELNRRVYLHHPDVMTIAEESTAWPGVSRSADHGGLGFGFKWDMGWMNDTLRFIAEDPVHRRWHHGELTFRMVYAFDENFVLSISHDEVVHGKGSLLGKQPGDRWQQFAGLRLLLGYQWSLPGKKLLFMGGEFGAPDEWNHEQELPWALMSEPGHASAVNWVSALNRVYRDEPALFREDASTSGFEWVIGDDADNSVLAYLRQADGARPVLAVSSFTPVPRPGYRIGVPLPGAWSEILNGDAHEMGGSGVMNGTLQTEPVPAHGHPQSLVVDVPPLAMCAFAPVDD